MPREKGFLGLGDDRTAEEAYWEGVNESKNAGLGDDFGKSITETLESFASSVSGGDGRSSTVQAYDAGWEDGKEDR